MESYQKIHALIESGNLEAALQEARHLLEDNSADAELYFIAGKLQFRMGDRSGAISSYAKAAGLNPSDIRYAAALSMSRDVEAFFNPDLLNP